jgi:hypothetical protein
MRGREREDGRKETIEVEDGVRIRSGEGNSMDGYVSIIWALPCSHHRSVRDEGECERCCRTLKHFISHSPHSTPRHTISPLYLHLRLYLFPTLTSSLGAGSFMALVTATLLLRRASLNFNLACSSLLPCFTSPPPSQLFMRVPSFL